jgi:hypothetical protein
MNDRDSLSELLTTLRPDALTEDAYQRHRSDDLARAFQTPRTAHHARRFRMSQRRPLYLIAGTAVAGLAAAAIIVPQLAPGSPPPGQAAGRETVSAGNGRGTPGTSTGPQTVNTRTVLLAVAKVAAEEPIGAGQVWYSRVRTTQLVQVDPDTYTTALKMLLDERTARREELKGKPAELKAYEKEFTKKAAKLKSTQLSYEATKAETTETWRSLKGTASRVISNQDVKIAFTSPEDEAKWKRSGSPQLSGDDKPRTAEEKGTPSSGADSGAERIVSIVNPSMTWSNLSKLPKDKEGLKAKLTALYAESPAKRDGDDFAGYLSSTAWDLLIAPIAPGTRSAMFQVLADSASGLRSQAGMTDGLGRTGVALDTLGPDDAGKPGRITYRLIFDERTGGVLELNVIEKGKPTPLLRQTFESPGYVDKLGDTP